MNGVFDRGFSTSDGKYRGRGRFGGRRNRELSISRNSNIPMESSRQMEPTDVEIVESPRDMNGNLIPITIKLELERGEGMEFIELSLNSLTEIANNVGMAIIDAQIVSDCRRLIVSFQVTCADYQSILCQFARKFFNIVAKNGMDSQRPVISTHSLLLYPLQLVNAHKNIPLSRIYFSSMTTNRKLNAHWIMTSGKDADRDREQGFSLDDGIYVSFDYDTRNISIEYCNVESDPFNLDIDYQVDGRISIDMSSIQSIFVDQMIEEKELHRISLVFILDFPPKFQVRRNGDSFWEYRTTVQRGANMGERASKEALHDSKAVILQFDTVKIENLLDRNSSIDSFIHSIITKLRHKTGKRIAYSSFNHLPLLEGAVRLQLKDVNGVERLNQRSSLVCPYYYNSNRYDGVRAEFDDRVCKYIHDASKKLIEKEGRMNEEESTSNYHSRLKVYRLRSFVQGILDKGMEFRSELLCDREIWYPFMEMLSNLYVKDDERTLSTLERVLTAITERRANYSITELFQREWNEMTHRRSILLNEQWKNDGFRRIMRFVVSPTKVEFVGYEMIMASRVLHKFGKNENHIIRVSFRDDRGEPIRPSYYPHEVKTRIRDILTKGLTYAGRTYSWLGNSNSQLREQQGCYMVHVDFQANPIDRLSPHEIRCQMGEFLALPNIPKMMARLGQVFTQCKPSETALDPSEVGVTFELVGGRNSAGKHYIFSDGVGCISQEYAEVLSKEHGLSTTASAFQIRFRGMKGMLCVDPMIDERNELLRFMGMNEKKKMCIRPSMIKFEVSDEDAKLEIVKINKTAVAFLNRPFINILCQVSEKQSVQCHRRMRRRIMELLHSRLRESIQSLYVERKALEAIREMAFPLSMEVFTLSSGINLTNEPFFRALLRSNMRFIMERQLQKTKIRIPPSSARTMFGVVDETGLLQYGQVYCQYTGSMSKTGGKPTTTGNRRGIVLTGRIMLTKNPCTSSGDVRMVEAVDIPALNHLADVIVFPMHGPRPHSDEMAGSDLDGDEYLVIWDEELFLERNEEASIFPMGDEREKWAIPKNEKGEIDLKKCEERKAEFYSEAIVHGQPGILSIAHLIISDLYGLDSKTSKSLAMKIAQTLDYQKTGVQPKKMTWRAEEDPDDRTRVIPAEKSNLKPDFLKSYMFPGYESRGILGELFRELSNFESGLDGGEKRMEKVQLDSSLLVSKWEKYTDEVKEELASYSYAMKNVIEQFGIATEEQMLCGMVGKGEDHGSQYVANRMIEGRVKRIQETAREKFFESLIDWKTELVEVENKRNDVKPDSILNRRVRSYTQNIEEIRRKAAATYCIAYEAANRSAERGEQCAILLSFPWLFHDVLIDIKTIPDDYVEGGEEENREQSNEPLAVHLSQVIDLYSENSWNLEKFSDFKRKFDNDDSIVGRSMKENEGLLRAAFVLVEWANHVGGISRRFGEEHLLYFFVLFGLGELNIRGMKRKFIQKPGGDMRMHSKKGEHLLAFLEYASSREFRVRSSLSFADIGGGMLIRGEWRAFSEVSLTSFLSLVMTHRLDLPMDGGSGLTSIVREYQPRVMQLPEAVITSGMEKVGEALALITGCQSVRLRRYTDQLAMVSAVGSTEQLRGISAYIYPPAPTRETATLKGRIESMASFTYDRLMKDATELISHQH